MMACGIEAVLTDTKPRDFVLATGVRPVGEPVHDLMLTVTIDTQLNIVAAEARSRSVPSASGGDRARLFELVGQSAQNFRKLALARLGDHLPHRPARNRKTRDEDPRVPRQGDPAPVRRAGAARLSRRSASKKRSKRRRSSAARCGWSRRRSTPAAAARAAASSSRARSTRSSSSRQILGMQLKTHQTGPEGQKVRRLLIEEGADIKKEYYVAALTDRATQKVALMALERRRHGHRGSGARHAREDHQGVRRPAGRPDRRARPTTRQRHRHPAAAFAAARRRAPSSTSATWRPTRRWPRSTR